MDKETIKASIKALSKQLPNNWPLYSFVTSNPLAGFENIPFEESISEIRKYTGVKGYPSTSVFSIAWDNGSIDKSILEHQLRERDIHLSIADSLSQMRELEQANKENNYLDRIDRHTVKWLTVFLDEGSTEWSMPNREAGFFKAWLDTAQFDHTLSNRHILNNLPDNSLSAIQQLLSEYEFRDPEHIIKHQLFALPGWVGYIKYRNENATDWQKAHPISLEDYLAVRLALCSMLDEEPISYFEKNVQEQRKLDQLKLAWLTALERTYQDELLNKIKTRELISSNGSEKRADAQLVFCIDTRSERIRRAIEKSGNYETFGYAGFFGVPLNYIHPESNIHHKSCPPILDAEIEATEKVHQNEIYKSENFDFFNGLKNAIDRLRFSLKNNIPASFGYVESTGLFYGFGLFFRTIAPNLIGRLKNSVLKFMGRVEDFSDISLSPRSTDDSPSLAELSTSKKAEIAKTAFELMGWDKYSELVVFAGHGSETSNNPFGSSLDCGACAGNKGRHNARALAGICNNRDVRKMLAENYDINIPHDTWFLAAEHNTTTNHIHIFDKNVPEKFGSQLKDLKSNLKKAQYYANLEQFDVSKSDQKNINKEAGRRAADWAETRPEWGLAGNASFIIAPRELTADLDLEARSFLHSYNWKKDPDGKKLEAILQGPMVVTQWINNHYYFASVDNQNFGSGTKVTQNVTGKFGVVQGNGGDLQYGLPFESLNRADDQIQHVPLRLTVVIYAPEERVESIIASHPETLGNLVDNKWIYLKVLDPNKEAVKSPRERSSVTPL